jgi:tetratricopeptide (TPR) repeat protein
MRDHWSVGLRLSSSRVGTALLLAAGLTGAQAQTPAADAAFRQGSEMYRAGNCAEAVRILSQSKGTPRALLLMGRCYLEMADFGAARTALQQYNQAVPGDEQAVILLARALEGAGDVPRAVTALEELHKQAPGSLAAQDALAEAYVKQSRPGLATPLYQAVLVAQPADVGALQGLAGLAASTSQWTLAVEQYKKALAVSPDNVAANIGLGQADLQLGQTAGAIPYLQHAARLRPDDWGLAKLLASCLVKTGQWPETIQALKYNSLAHTDDEEALGWMVQAFGHTKDTAQAEQYYRAVLQRAASNFAVRMTLANLLYDSKRTKDAREQYVLILKARPDLVEINDRVGQMAEQDGNVAEAIQYYAAADQSPQATSAMKMRLARLYFRTGDLEHAKPVLEAALKAEPDNREIKTLLMQAAVKSGHTDEAAKYAVDLLPGDPNNLEMLRLLGDEAIKNNKDAEAADYLERATVVNEKDRDLRFELVGLYTNDQALDRMPRAFELMNEYVGLNPDDYEGYLLLANLYRRKGDAANAHDFFSRGFARIPPKPPARMSWAYNSVGMLLFSEANFEDALAYQAKAVELNPNDANAQYNLALTYLKLKRKEEVNLARTKLSTMGAPELVAALDEAIQRSRINEGKK